jgi:hypothetical protein
MLRNTLSPFTFDTCDITPSPLPLSLPLSCNQMKALFGSGGGDVNKLKYSLPPFPHPVPERSLSLHCSSEGLFIVAARPIQKPALTSTFRQHHSPRTSISSLTEDIASDINLASRRDASSELSGAKISWGRGGKVQAASSAELRRLPKEDVLLCYGIIGIQRLFNGE